MSMSAANDTRVDFLVSSHARALIENAALLTGQSVSDFAVSALLEKARQIVQAERVRLLSEEEARAFLSLLDSDNEPNEALRKAAAQYKENHAGSLAD